MSELLMPPGQLRQKALVATKLPAINSMKAVSAKDGDSFMVGPSLYLFVAGDVTPEDGKDSIAPNAGPGRFRKIAAKLR